MGGWRSAGLTAAAAVGRVGVRAVGMSTAGQRPLPDFLVIGAKRGGTTSLYFDLLRHPQVVPLFPRPERLPGKRTFTKGVHYFDAHAHRSERWYRSHLPSARVRAAAERRNGAPVVVTGEASPYYLFHPLAPQRAAAMLPDVKLIASLRDPVERTFSHWKERRREGVETLSFLDALAVEDERVAQDEEALRTGRLRSSYAHEQQTYARQSEYITCIERWLTHFPLERLLVVTTEDYGRSGQTVVAQITDFLGLRRATMPAAKVLNSTTPADMSPQARRMLEERFAPYNDRLERLLGRTLPWS